MINNINEVIEFLHSHQNPKIVISSTLEDGFVACIAPIPTICGAELYCSKNTINDVTDIIKEIDQYNEIHQKSN